MKFKRETKMAMFAYGCIATVYIGLIYAFASMLFANNQEFDIKKAILMVFVFCATSIMMYKGTKDIKSDYLKALAMFLIPTIIVFSFKDCIELAVFLMLGYFICGGIYKVTPEPKKIGNKIFKLLAIVTLCIAILIATSYLLGGIIGQELIKTSNQYNSKGFIEIPSGAIYLFSTINNFGSNAALLIASLLFISFATKEIIKETIVKYKPTDKETGDLIKGTVAIFITILILTMGIQYEYKKNIEVNHASMLIDTNLKVKNILLDDSNTDVKAEKINKELNKIDTRSALSYYYITDILNIGSEYTKETQNVTDIKAINVKYADKIDMLDARIVENEYKLQNIVYNIIFGLFAMFILLEIYEEIRIINMLKENEKVKESK